MHMRRYRSLSVVVSAIAVSALVGGLFGRRLLADDKVSDHYKAFTAALSAVETSYVEKIDSDRLVYSAVRGMLSTLDPHSSFYDPREYAQMRERQEGHYYGIGIQISAVDGDVIAQLVFEGSPSYKAGIRQGDVLARIAGEDTKSWNCATPSDCTERAMKKLRGARGTPVEISLRRRGYKDLMPVELVRDEIVVLEAGVRAQQDRPVGRIAVEAPKPRQPEQPGDDPHPAAAQVHRLRIEGERVEACLRPPERDALRLLHAATLYGHAR